MNYEPGERVSVRKLTDEEILALIPQWKKKDYETILGNETEEEQQDARVYLQIWYEKFLRGESTRSILRRENRDDDEERAIRSAMNLAENFTGPFRDMLQGSDEDTIDGKNVFEIRVLQALSHAEELINPDPTKNTWEEDFADIIVQTLFQLTKYKDSNQTARLMGTDFITDLGLRLSYFFSVRVRRMMQTEHLEKLKSELTGKEFQAIETMEDRNSMATKPHETDKYEAWKRVKPFEKIAYNCLLLLFELEWVHLKIGDFGDLITAKSLEEDEATLEKGYPNILVFREEFYNLIHDPDTLHIRSPQEWEDFYDENGGRNKHPLFDYFNSSERNRWSYAEPLDHQWVETQSSKLRIEPKTMNKEDQIFAKERNQHPGQAIARGFLTPPSHSKGSGYRQLREVITNLEDYENLGQIVDSDARWYDNPPTVGRNRGIASKKSIDALNHLQKTQWEINTDFLNVIAEGFDKEENQLDLNSPSTWKNLDKITIIKESEKDGLKGIKLPKNRNTRKKWELVITDWVRKILSLNGNVFWHVWACGWRGRLYPRCALLSPQESDIDRALLRFKEWKPLGESGWKWLRAHLFNLTATNSTTDGLKLSDARNKKATIEWRANWISEHIEYYKEIASDPIKHIDKWQETPKAKGESMQRLAAILEVVRVYDEHKKHGGQPSDWDKVKSGMPIQLDGSCNVYQHLSALLRNKELAEKVNVLAIHETDLRDQVEPPYLAQSDLYQLVVEKARRAYEAFDETGEHESLCSELFRHDNLNGIFTPEIIDQIFSRKFAKNITMTLAYGTKDFQGKFMGNKSGRPGYLTRKHVYCGKSIRGELDFAYECHETGCDYKSATGTSISEEEAKMEFVNHLYTKHKGKFEDGKHLIETIHEEDVPEKQLLGQGKLIPFEKDTPARIDIHIQNLNRHTNPVTKSGTIQKPYPYDKIMSCRPTRTVVYYLKKPGATYNPAKDCIEEGDNYNPEEDDEELWEFNCAYHLDKNKSKSGSGDRWGEIRKSKYLGPKWKSTRVPIWHEASLLYELLGEEISKTIPPKLQATLASKLGLDYKNAAEFVTAGANKSVEDELTRSVKKAEENIVMWTTPIGFRVLNYYPYRKTDGKLGGTHGSWWTKYWGPQFTKANPLPTISKYFKDISAILPKFDFDNLIQNAYRKKRVGGVDDMILRSIILALPVEPSEVEAFIEKPYSKSMAEGQDFMDKFMNILDGKNITFHHSVVCRPLIHEINRELGRIDPSEDKPSGIGASDIEEYSKFRRSVYRRATFTPSRVNSNIPKPIRMPSPIPHGKSEEKIKDQNKKKKKSRKKITDEMQRGITPNFIQSLDGAHMTMVINEMCADESINDFWAIHDCFGVHPSDTDTLVKTVKRTFKELHKNSLCEWMKKINPKHQTSDIPDPTFQLNSDTEISNYLIS